MQRNPSIWVFFFLPKASFKMGTFSDPQHTHLNIFILKSPPPPQLWWPAAPGVAVQIYKIISRCFGWTAGRTPVLFTDHCIWPFADIAVFTFAGLFLRVRLPRAPASFVSHNRIDSGRWNPLNLGPPSLPLPLSTPSSHVVLLHFLTPLLVLILFLPRPFWLSAPRFSRAQPCSKCKLMSIINAMHEGWSGHCFRARFSVGGSMGTGVEARPDINLPG